MIVSPTRLLAAISISLLATFVAEPAVCMAEEIEARRTDVPIEVDGVFNESAWQDAATIDGLVQFTPVHNQPSPFRTTVKMLYDDNALYFAFYCYDPEPDKIIAKDTKRDGFFLNDDMVDIYLDTFNDKSNCYIFGVNPNGTVQDGRHADNGRTFDINWDGEWKAATRITADGWTCEYAIPFSTLMFNEKGTTWGINFERRVTRNRERSTWTDDVTSISQVSAFGSLTGLDLSSVSVKRYKIIPYAQLQVSKDNKPEDEYGVNVRYNLTSNFGIEAALNPDFATIEADVEQVNLTRFELYYPEKRPFFLEGGENYVTGMRQFYSRRIGEIPWGVKLNGKFGTWKVNSLVTASDPSTAGAMVSPGKDALYTVFRVNKETSNGSTIGLIGSNRTYDEENSGSLGMAASIFFTDEIGLTSQLINTWGTEDNGTWAWSLNPSYRSPVTRFSIEYTDLGTGVRENINPVGMIQDDDRREFDTSYNRQFWINSHGIDQISGGFSYNQYYSQAGDLRQWSERNNLSVQFLKKWDWSISNNSQLIRFEKDFRNSQVSNSIQYDSKTGTIASMGYSFGKNYDRDFDSLTGSLDVKLMRGWDVEYSVSRYWFRPGNREDNSLIHYVRSTYYVNPDMYFKLFYQTRYTIFGDIDISDFDTLRQNVQLLYVWRFLPPFGSLQLAYQEGSIMYTDRANDNQKSFFCKLSWVL